MRRIILRTADHRLVKAFRSPMIDLFIAGPARSAPDVVIWGSRVFTFSTMDDESCTFSEAFTFALAEGQTCDALTDEEMAAIPSVSPEVIFNG